MREIKFRAWHIEKQIMIQANCLYFNEFNTVEEQFNDEDYVFMQYTGLKDKNEKEIYEGDILKISNISVLRCEFRNGCFILVHSKEFAGVENLLWENLGRLYDAGMNDIFELTEVIGNIYENSNLLGDNIEQN